MGGRLAGVWRFLGAFGRGALREWDFLGVDVRACRGILGGVLPRGFVLGPGSFQHRRASVREKFLSRASHVKSLGLHSVGIPLAYNAYAVSVVQYTAQLSPLDGSMQLVGHMALGTGVCGAHVCTTHHLGSLRR